MKPSISDIAGSVLAALVLAYTAQAGAQTADTTKSVAAQPNADDDEDIDDGDDAGDLSEDFDKLPVNLRDRGTGIPISQLGTYVRPREWLLIPTVRYSDDKDFEYNSGELGFTPAVDQLEGHYQASQGTVLVAYGLNERLAVEFSAEVIEAKLRTAPDDPSNAPPQVKQSGLGRVMARVDWRWLTESGGRPEVVTYAQVRVPHNRDDLLIGTPDWVINAGIGATRGSSWGTVTLRAAVEYDAGSASRTDWGQVALEYLKRISPHMTVLGSVQMNEGDEGSLFGQLQWRVSPDFAVQLGSGVALTRRAIDWAPQLSFVIQMR